MHATLGLIELLVVISILGVISALAIPYFGNLQSGANREKNRRNAQQIAALSMAVNAIGVAHVLPDSLGGVEATARLLREGITVPDGPSRGEHIALSGLTDREIELAAPYLEIAYHANQIALNFNPDI